MTKGYMCFQMGSCVTIDWNPDSAMKLHFSFVSKAEKILIPLPTVDKPLNGDHSITGLGFKSLSSPQLSSLTSFRDFGSSKEEIFFDSQSWLESDCEDDFFSVKSDFTPSGASTPSHHSGFIVTPRLNISLSKDGAADTRTETSPPYKRKKLAELFLENFCLNKSLSKDGAAGTRTETSPPYKRKKLAELFLENFCLNKSLSKDGAAGTRTETSPPYKRKKLAELFLENFCDDQYVDYQKFAANQSVSNGKLELKPIKKKSARATQCCLPIFGWS